MGRGGAYLVVFVRHEFQYRLDYLFDRDYFIAMAMAMAIAMGWGAMEWDRMGWARLCCGSVVA